MALERSSTLVYGDSGTGKTTLGLSLVRYVHREFGKKVRMVLGDFQEGETLAPFLRSGLVEALDISQYPHCFELLSYLAMGHWPDPGGLKDWPTKDPKAIQSLKPSTPETWKQVGGYIFDSLTGYCSLYMRNMEHRAARGEKLGQDPPITIKDGTVNVGGNSMAHYGFAQRRILDFVEKAKCLPCHRLFTALETKAEDKTVAGKAYVIGPEMAGKAMTPTIPKAFGNVFNLVHEPVKDKRERRLYLNTWFDGLDITPRLGKCSLPALVYAGDPAYLVIPQPIPKDGHWGLGAYLELLEKMQKQAEELGV